jgi:hypothetical protein
LNGGGVRMLLLKDNESVLGALVCGKPCSSGVEFFLKAFFSKAGLVSAPLEAEGG